MQLRLSGFLLVGLFTYGCTTSPAPGDASGTDVGTGDAGLGDAGLGDAGASDASAGDAPTPDAGSDAGPLLSPIESGARLRARVRDGGEGAELLLGWYDSLLGTNCTFALDTATPPTLRCVPDTTWELRGFSDAACTVPIVFPPDPMPAPAFAVTSITTEAACAGRPVMGDVFVVGTTRTSITSLYVSDGAGGCQAVTLPSPRESLPTTPLMESGMVHATVAPEVSSDRLARIILAADDGARAVVGAHDTMRGEDCTRLGRFPADHRCVPMASAPIFESYFTNAGCSVPAALASSSGCTPTVAYTIDGETTCGWRPAVFAAGAPATALYTGACAPFPLAGEPFFSVGAALASDALVDMVPVDVGTGRLRAQYLGERVDGAALVRRDPTIDFHDTMLDVDCSAGLAADGMVRCIPTVALRPQPQLYADATCTGAVIAAGPGLGCLDSTARYATDARSEGTHVYALSTPTTTAYLLDFGTCMPITPGTGVTYYVLDAEIDPPMLAPVRDGID